MPGRFHPRFVDVWWGMQDSARFLNEGTITKAAKPGTEFDRTEVLY